ncbi:MAG TPA: hypothetical protein VE422_46590, partial [Terriglobia bacterium]|nr:hypothetical protein [Terriglobia bacterium]
CRAIRRERGHGRGRYRDSAGRVGLTGCGKAGLYWPAGPVAAVYDRRYFVDSGKTGARRVPLQLDSTAFREETRNGHRRAL